MKKLIFILFVLISLPSIAQDIIVTNAGESIKVKNIDCSSADFVYFQPYELDSVSIQRMKKSEILIIRMADGTKIDPNVSTTSASQKETAQEEKSKFPDIDLTQFHGFLLAKGNCVYVTANRDLDYENAAVERIKHNIKNLGFWTVVDTPEQAHFVFQYGVCLEGRDLACVFLRTREGYKKHPNCTSILLNKFRGRICKKTESMVYGAEYASEEVNDNIKVADSMFGYRWEYWAKELSKEKMKKNIVEIFYIP